MAVNVGRPSRIGAVLGGAIGVPYAIGMSESAILVIVVVLVLLSFYFTSKFDGGEYSHRSFLLVLVLSLAKTLTTGGW